jgi:hypothetical protein
MSHMRGRGAPENFSRGGFAGRGRQTNNALLRTAFVKADQSNSARRL